MKISATYSPENTVLAFTYLQWDVVVHSSRQSDWCSIVGEGPEHMQVPGHRTQKVQPQVTESNNGIAKKAKSLEG